MRTKPRTFPIPTKTAQSKIPDLPDSQAKHNLCEKYHNYQKRHENSLVLCFEHDKQNVHTIPFDDLF